MITTLKCCLKFNLPRYAEARAVTAEAVSARLCAAAADEHRWSMPIQSAAEQLQAAALTAQLQTWEGIDGQ